MTVDWDIVVIGAGAAGLMAGICAAEAGRRVLLLEKNRKPGVKILMSGGTRCNITHDCDNRGIVKAFGRNGAFLYSALANFGPREVVAFFETEGVATKVEETGKIFPVSNRACDVLDALCRRLHRSGAVLSLAEPVRDVVPEETGFRIVSEHRCFTAAKVILTTGGRSYPGSGTTGDGYAWAVRLGHTLKQTRPALVPIRVAADWLSELRGITVPDVVLRVFDTHQPKPLDSRRGSLLMAHFGLSGPVALDISGTVSGHAQPTTLQLEIDLLPEHSERDFDEQFRVQASAAGKQLLASVLGEWLPRRLADRLLTQVGLPVDRRAAALSKADRLSLVACIKRWRIPIGGTLGYEKAEVTAGGIAVDEVDSRTMQSRRQPGLYLAGEILDLDGPIGGYNFQAAWSTGWLAGTRAAE